MLAHAPLQAHAGRRVGVVHNLDQVTARGARVALKQATDLTFQRARVQASAAKFQKTCSRKCRLRRRSKQAKRRREADLASARADERGLSTRQVAFDGTRFQVLSLPARPMRSAHPAPSAREASAGGIEPLDSTPRRSQPPPLDRAPHDKLLISHRDTHPDPAAHPQCPHCQRSRTVRQLLRDTIAALELKAGPSPCHFASFKIPPPEVDDSNFLLRLEENRPTGRILQPQVDHQNRPKWISSWPAPMSKASMRTDLTLRRGASAAVLQAPS